MCKRKMAEKKVRKNTLSLGDRVKLIDYMKKNPALEVEKSPKSLSVAERRYRQF